VLVLLRGDHTLDEKKLRGVLGAEARAAGAEEIRAAFGAEPGSLGPLRLRGVRVLADEALHGRRNMVCGANRDGFHTSNVTPGRDFKAEFHELRVAGDAGTPVLAADFGLLGWTRETGSACEGVLDLGAMLAGVPRDGAGLIMPKKIAPFSVVVVPVNVADEAQRSAAEALYEQASAAGCDAVLDDREERPGVKFKDSELVGIPWRVTLGKKLGEGKAEVYERSSGEKWDVAVGEAVEFVRGRWDLVV
jgi:prolyl-tRNA synthetase